jgi:transcriptional regulator with AAA-type ATPase domain
MALRLFGRLVEERADPGILFMDEIARLEEG